ncbi:hypothetical protein CDD83_2530 [Cordyceps sp. RAO-2017]|nr:hypothetical protein CDD83_2530 [Cordyceps sp. RAO-2017]
MLPLPSVESEARIGLVEIAMLDESAALLERIPTVGAGGSDRNTVQRFLIHGPVAVVWSRWAWGVQRRPYRDSEAVAVDPLDIASWSALAVRRLSKEPRFQPGLLTHSSAGIVAARPRPSKAGAGDDVRARHIPPAALLESRSVAQENHMPGRDMIPLAAAASSTLPVSALRSRLLLRGPDPSFEEGYVCMRTSFALRRNGFRSCLDRGSASVCPFDRRTLPSWRPGKGAGEVPGFSRGDHEVARPSTDSWAKALVF